ncbi:fec operon regulator FecR [compost metagenome]
MHQHYNDSDEARISKNIDDFKENPAAWDEEKMGSAQEVRNTVLNRLLNDIGENESRPVPFIRTLLFRRVISAAASVVVVMGLLWLGLNYKNNSSDQSVLPLANMVIVKTSKDDVRKIKLSDGSIIWLNSNSTLSYPEKFSATKRQVDLIEGEAYFDIRHDTHKPFQVKAGKTLTNVLGTAFNISSYSWLKEICVTVRRGKVAVNNEVLLPNQQLVYSKASGKVEQKEVHAADVVSWMERKLSFNDEDFKTVAAKIEDKFKVKISFENKTMQDLRFTARFEPTESLRGILDALTITTGLNYQVKDNNILITN